MNLSEISRLTEDQSRDYFERIRWPGPAQFARIADRSRAGSFRAKFIVSVSTSAKAVTASSQRPSVRFWRTATCRFRTWLMAFSILRSGEEGRERPPIAAPIGIGKLPERVASGA